MILLQFSSFSFVVADVPVIQRDSHLWVKTINVSTRMFTVRVASLKKQDENWLNSCAYVFISPRCIRVFSCAFTVAYANVYLTSVNRGFKEKGANYQHLSTWTRVVVYSEIRQKTFFSAKDEF